MVTRREERREKIHHKLEELKAKLRHRKSSIAVDTKEDDGVNGLSHVGHAAYEVLNTKHAKYQTAMWNLTFDKMIGSLHHTPLSDVYREATYQESLLDNQEHSNWFPEKMCQIMSKTTKWCDVMSLSPPDGYFRDQFKIALKNICDTAKDADEPIIIRLTFGNIIGMPVNCERLVRKLTEDLPEKNNIQLWAGAWRYGQSWNHSKLIAVDGKYLHTGGHNLWTDVYLHEDPVHDLSLQMEGMVANDAHKYANEQWSFIEQRLDRVLGKLGDKVPDFVPLGGKGRVNVCEYGKGAKALPPYYRECLFPSNGIPEGAVPVISMGWLGTLVDDDRPSDDAFTAMINSSKYIVKMCLQDIGPFTIPGNIKKPLLGTGWPNNYLNAIARAIWQRDVDFQIVLSNPGCRFGYSSGWAAFDVGAKIIKRIKKLFPDASHDELRRKVEDNLRISYMRHAPGDKYPSGGKVANHTKYFIIDDICSYIGSQNLYVCDLAEWGVVIDDIGVTTMMIQDYWDPLWEASFDPADCNVQDVMVKIKDALKAFGRVQAQPENDVYDEKDE